MAITAKQERLLAYNTVLTKNKKRLKPGMEFSRKEFIQLFSIPMTSKNKTYKEAHKNNLRLVAAQAEINLLMRENGMCIKSKDYYSTFLVASKQQVKSTIVNYSRAVDVVSYHTTRMLDSVEKRVKASSWGHYRKLSADRIANLVCTPSYRHAELEKHVRTL